MTLDDRRLLRHLVTAVAVKMIALAILWWVFFHDHRPAQALEDSAANASAHILGTSSRPGEPF